jgi:hypothetical protein
VLSLRFVAALYILISFLFFSSDLHSSVDKVQEEVLTSAEGFFIALKEKRFDDAWKSLTTKSRDTIVSEVYKEINKTKAKIGRELVTEDFDNNGELSRCYWDAFIKNFDPDAVLEQSTWNIGQMKEDTAIIVLQYKESQYNSELKLFKEDGRWRVGLIESFWMMKRYLK